jgi:hypothetical protein
MEEVGYTTQCNSFGKGTPDDGHTWPKYVVKVKKRRRK